MKRIFFCSLMIFILAACIATPVPTPAPPPSSTPLPPTLTETPTPTFTATLTETPTPSPTPKPAVPNFDHVVIIVLENKEFGIVIGNPTMPYFNKLAQDNTLLTQFYAVTHPSLPNYLSLIGGDTFGITTNCEDCFIDAPSLPDLIEQSKRTWKGYMESMPSACFMGSTDIYAQKHNPFVYFDPIRLDNLRCKRNVVPFTQLDEDLAARTLPNFVFITPNLCNNAHDCGIDVADDWLRPVVEKLRKYFADSNKSSLIVLTFDEGNGEHGCCGIDPAGGRIATILISPEAKNGFQDDTPYTTYSLLKTISAAWGLPYLAHAADEANMLITAPWK